MKRIKTFVTMFAAAAALILLPDISTLKASAAAPTPAPTTFYIDYDPDFYIDEYPNQRGWYVLVEADMEDKENAEQKLLQVYYNLVKDGDIVVVSNFHEKAPLLDLGDVRLSNVTVLQNSQFFMFEASQIEDFFALSGSACSVTAPITNAYVYDPTLTNFNGDVQNIHLNVDGGEATSTMGCGGTVGSLTVHFTQSNTSYSLYDFKKDTFAFEEGYVTTNPYFFSTSPRPIIPTTPTVPTVIPTLKDLFDEHYYADKYPDLKAIYGYNREALWTHYITSGINEFRSMNSLLNVANYRYQYPDLSKVYGDNWDAYVAHYVTSGALEGRDPGTEFNAVGYANKYADLRAIFGYDVMALWQHYKTAGIAEGRTSS